eukprot:6468830-Heterocapsa_arctica.AAC.1
MSAVNVGGAKVIQRKCYVIKCCLTACGLVLGMTSIWLVCSSDVHQWPGARDNKHLLANATSRISLYNT